MKQKEQRYRAAFALHCDLDSDGGLEAARAYLDGGEWMLHFQREAIVQGRAQLPIRHIAWVLQSARSGYVELVSERKLNREERLFLSRWIHTEAACGIGVCFDQQPFVTQLEDHCESAHCGLGHSASFDWRSNMYDLVAIKEPAPMEERTLRSRIGSLRLGR